MESCKLEPNLGIHDYYQAKTKQKLKGKQWLCFGENLVISDQDAENLVHSKGVIILLVLFIKILPISVFTFYISTTTHYKKKRKYVFT